MDNMWRSSEEGSENANVTIYQPSPYRLANPTCACSVMIQLC